MGAGRAWCLSGFLVFVAGVASAQAPVSPWVDLGGGTAGGAGTPQLAMLGCLGPDSDLGMEFISGPPTSMGLLFVKVGGTSTPTVFIGGTLHAFPFDLLHPVVTDGNGEIRGSALFPPTPTGTELWFQVGIYDTSEPIYGAVLSNATLGTVPDVFDCPDPCTPAIQDACWAQGLSPCTVGSGSPDCGPPEPCTPAVQTSCVNAGLLPCTMGTGSSNCGPPDPCTPAKIQLCLNLGFCACIPGSGSGACGMPNPCTPAVQAACVSAGLAPCDPLACSPDCL